jgi:uncharacterized protein with von Willebrand factor type A (vWA) domain
MLEAQEASKLPTTPIVSRVVRFVRLLRTNGYAVGMTEAIDAGRAAAAINVLDIEELRQALRLVLCSSRTDRERFDDIFEAFWLNRRIRRRSEIKGRMDKQPSDRALTNAPPEGIELTEPKGGAPSPTDSAGGGEASQWETLEDADFRHVNDREAMARLTEITERFAARMRYRLTRRWRTATRGRRLDLRNTIHRSLRYGGTPMRLAYRKRRTKPLKLVVILDASGSMSVYNSFFLRFLRAVVDKFHEADAFVFHTRLVHVGPALRERDMARAIDRLALMATGWSGGTRIGESLRTFDRNFASGCVHGRTVVMIISDGYDTGPPEVLSEALKSIKKRAKALVWLNPMMGWEGYQPLAKGMQAALPHLDMLAPAHNIKSLMALEPYLARL